MRYTALLFAAGAAFALTACTPEKAPQRAADSARTFTSDRISVVTRGAGPDIVLIPGLASSRDVWSTVADSLDDRYKLHLVQVNGFAGAAPGANAEGPVSAPVAEEIDRYIRELGLARPAVIGHSMGGSIGMMLAARHPASVGRLMVVDMTPWMAVMLGPAAGTPEGLRKAADGMRDSILKSPNMLEQMFTTMTRVPEMRTALAQQVRASHRPTVANAMHELLTTDLRPEIGRITAPTTLLYVIPPNIPMSAAEFDAGTRQGFANLPGTRIVKIENSAHFIQFDQPARFIAEVDAFMKR
jgi:pimeloyl-ACP methyl ester carboxylesterase